MSSPNRSTYRCSFCGKMHDQVRRMIAGPGGVYICNECVQLCQKILDEEERAAAQRDTQTPPTS